MASIGKGILPEGASITRPPEFCGEHFSFRKVKFKVFIIANKYGLWQVIQDGDYVPMKREGERIAPKMLAEFDDNDKKLVTLNSKAVLMIQSDLNQKEYFKICTFPSAKDMWENLRR